MAWIIKNNQLINDECINVGTKPFVGDSPYTMWRIDPNANGGIPYSPLMIGVAATVPTPPPTGVPFYYNGNQMTEVIYNGNSLTEFIYNEPT